LNNGQRKFHLYVIQIKLLKYLKIGKLEKLTLIIINKWNNWSREQDNYGWKNIIKILSIRFVKIGYAKNINLE
jgi:hypothetical protein